MDEDGLDHRSIPFSIAIGKPNLVDFPPKQFAEALWMLGVPSLRSLTKSSLDIIQKGRMTGYYSPPLTERGDSTVTRSAPKLWKRTVKKSISQHSIARITQFRDRVEAKGATLVLSLPWFLVKTDGQYDTYVANMQEMAEELAKIAPLIYNEETLNMQTEESFFADTGHHLTQEGRRIRAGQLISELKPVIAVLE